MPTSPDGWHAPAFWFLRIYPRKYGLANLSDSKPRMGVSWDVHGAKYVNVHRPDPIIVGSVTAAVADVFMSFVFTVRFMDSPTLRTTLRSVLCADLQNFRAVFQRFVLEKLFELIERPRAKFVSSFLGSFQVLFLKAHACQILDHEQRALTIRLNECLRNPIVHIRNPTVLSFKNGFASALTKLYHISLSKIQEGESVPPHA